MKKVLVTGFGFIGSHVVEELAARGIHAVVFDRYQPKNDWFNVDVPYDFILGDIRDRNAISEAVGLCDGAINLAGILGTSETVDNPFPSVETNVIGGLNFLEACRNHDKPGVQIAVGNHFMNNTYAITKTTVERLALMYNKEHGTKIAVVRGLNAYGERQKHKPVRKITPNFVCSALRSESIKIFGNGESIMDMIYVKDLARILVEALLNPNVKYDKIYSAGTGVKTTVNDIAQVVNDLTMNHQPVVHVPMRAGEIAESVVLGEPETLAELGITPDSLTTLTKGMLKTIDWYYKNYPWQED